MCGGGGGGGCGCRVVVAAVGLCVSSCARVVAVLVGKLGHPFGPAGRSK